MPANNLSRKNDSLPELLTFHDLKIHFGISRTSAYRWMRTDGFPVPIQLGANSVRISRIALEEWIDSRPAASAHGIKEAVA